MLANHLFAFEGYHAVRVQAARELLDADVPAALSLLAENPLRSFTLHARPTGKQGNDPQDHPFNLFVLLPQPGGARPLPITIDPDVKNPPPNS